MRRSSCFTSPSKMPACAGGAELNGPPPWASLPSSSVRVSRGQRDEEDEKSPTPFQDNEHDGSCDYRLVRTFAVKPRAFGAPLRGFGA
jgi:hypothetical protein